MKEGVYGNENYKQREVMCSTSPLKDVVSTDYFP